ncbi:Mitochondrial distribution and morphology protein 12, partial [Cryomyces antarcticus]
SKHVLPAPLHRQDEFDPDENAGSDSNDDDIGLGDDGLAHTREMRSATREGSNERSSHENPSKAQDHPMESQMERHVTRSHDPETPYPSVAEARFDSLSGENAEQRAIPVNHPPAQQRPSMVHISQSHLPGFKVSRPSSTDGGDLDSASQPPGATHIAFKDANELPLRDGALKTTRGADHKTTQVQPQVKRRVLSKRFWMKDENARECFYCGNAFSTFRRKHHCRTCGQIFDGKCTILLPGALFGQSGSIRLCKPCEGILYGHDDNSSVFSEDEDLQRNSYYELG